MIQAGRSLESPRLAQNLSRSGTCRTANSALPPNMVEQVPQLEPWPTWCECVNQNLSFFMCETLMFRLLRRLLKKQCMRTADPQKMPGALCASLSLPSRVRAEGNLSPAWECPSPFPSPRPPLIPFLRTQEAALPTWSPGPEC